MQFFLKMPLEDVQADDPVLREALDAAKKVMDENHTLLRKLKSILVAEIGRNTNKAMLECYKPCRWGFPGRSVRVFQVLKKV